MDMVGHKFGRLTVLEEIEERKHNRVQYNCLCDCGNSKVVAGSHLRTCAVLSCGCIHRERTMKLNKSHGMADTPTYCSWRSMKDRCLGKNSFGYSDYGGRGISICDRWINSFQNFYDDMGERPDGKTLDRIDNNGNYEPSNCRWATRKEQANNRRLNSKQKGRK